MHDDYYFVMHDDYYFVSDYNYVVFFCGRNCMVDIHLLRVSTSYNRPVFPT